MQMIKSFICFISELTKNLVKWPTIIFLLVLSSSFVLVGINISQFIYGFLAFFFFFKNHKYIQNTKVIKYVLFFSVVAFINFFLYQNKEAFGSSLRFIYNLLLYSVFLMSFDNRITRPKVVNGYIYASTFFSLFIIIQFITYYLLGVNIKIAYGDYNTTGSAYDPLSGMLYRTGGFFNEPSWYAAFCSPCIFIVDRLKNKKALIICILGTFLSTSGTGYLVLAFYGLWKIFNMKPIYTLICLVIIIILLTPIMYLLAPNIDKMNLENERLSIYAYMYMNSVITLLGTSPNPLYVDGKLDFFLNTLSFIYLFWGALGIAAFYRVSYYNKMIFLTFSIFAVMAVEGLYGRMDFWMMLLACKLFNIELNLSQTCRVR